MSSRRSRSRQSGDSIISDDQIADLVSKLQLIIPESRTRRSDKVELYLWCKIYIIRGYNFEVQHRFAIYSNLVSASKVLQETCNYIRSLHREMEDLSDRLSVLLESTETDSAQAAIIRSLLM